VLAVRSYQKLEARGAAGKPIPNAVVNWLKAQVKNAAAIEAQANQVAAKVQAWVHGQHSIHARTVQDSASIRTKLELALHRGLSLQMVYHSPYSGSETQWQIQVRELYESNEHLYIEAHCEKLSELRTFRLDRIVRVWEDERENPGQ
jgi:predicted DNA-binding transcriptional regulator YafY